MLKSSDLFIIKIRVYASPYFMKLFHKKDERGLIKMKEAADAYLHFFWSLFEFVTKKSQNDFTLEYMLGAKDCAAEVLRESKGITICTGGAYYHYLIPIQNKEIIEWIKNNINNIPHKIIKKTNYIFWMNHYNVPADMYREMYKTPEHIKELLLKANENSKNS